MARTKTGKAKVLTPDEFKRLLIICASRKYAERDTLLVLFSFGLGLRAIELSSLKVMDIIADDFSIIETLNLQVTKGDKPRTVYLTDEKIRKHIERYMKWLNNYHDRKRTYLKGSDPFFISQKVGNGFNNNTLTILFGKIYKEAGIKASSHSGRRTFATNLIQQGIDIKSLQLLMGHANVQQTLEYVDGNPERMKKFITKALY